MTFPTDRYQDELGDILPPATYEEKCGKCGGSGEFRSWAGRTVGNCFACNGTGKKTFKTSPETRVQAREYRADRGERQAQERAEAAANWIAGHKDEHVWLVVAAARNANLPPEKAFTLPASLLEALTQYGSLTEKQLAAVRTCMARDASRAEARAQRQANAPVVDVSKIQQAFDHAKRRELERKPGAIGVWAKPLKLRTGNLDFTVEPGREGSKWEGILFITAGYDRERDAARKLGMIQNGKFIAKFECTQIEADAVVAACSDPHAAAKTWCQAYGQCQVCGRTLTNKTSIEEGIGPVCAEKYGW